MVIQAPDTLLGAALGRGERCEGQGSLEPGAGDELAGLPQPPCARHRDGSTGTTLPCAEPHGVAAPTAERGAGRATR